MAVALPTTNTHFSDKATSNNIFPINLRVDIEVACDIIELKPPPVLTKGQRRQIDKMIVLAIPQFQAEVEKDPSQITRSHYIWTSVDYLNKNDKHYDFDFTNWDNTTMFMLPNHSFQLGNNSTRDFFKERNLLDDKIQTIGMAQPRLWAYDNSFAVDLGGAYEARNPCAPSEPPKFMPEDPKYQKVKEVYRVRHGWRFIDCSGNR